jgi:hypothetical protein
MKYILKLSCFLPVILFLFLFQAGISSCKKETTYITDTIIKKDTALTTQLLTSHSWKIFEERGVSGGVILYYLRGGSNNTQSFDNEYITFNANNTGLLVNNAGIQTSFTWNFVNADNTKLTWTVTNTPATYTITWENIRYKNGNLQHDQYFTDANTGKNSHSQQIRMPK